jgi:hypothetical protein
MSTAPQKHSIPHALIGAEMMTAKMVRMKNTSDERMSAVESFMSNLQEGMNECLLLLMIIVDYPIIASHIFYILKHLYLSYIGFL